MVEKAIEAIVAYRKAYKREPTHITVTQAQMDTIRLDVEAFDMHPIDDDDPRIAGVPLLVQSTNTEKML